MTCTATTATGNGQNDSSLQHAMLASLFRPAAPRRPSSLLTSSGILPALLRSAQTHPGPARVPTVHQFYRSVSSRSDMSMSRNISVHFLGTTSGGGPTETRNCSSLVVDPFGGSGQLWSAYYMPAPRLTPALFAKAASPIKLPSNGIGDGWLTSAYSGRLRRGDRAPVRKAALPPWAAEAADRPGLQDLHNAYAR